MSHSLRIAGAVIRTVRHHSELFSDARKSAYYEPSTSDEITQLILWCKDLANGELLFVRGRDILRSEETGLILGFTEWEHGLALKTDTDSFFFLWREEVERFRIKEVNFLEQLQFESRDGREDSPVAALHRGPQKTIILCHGFCPEYGPNYPLIESLSVLLRAAGHNVIVPDFRSSYKFGSGRARSERVRVILEELLDVSFQQRSLPSSQPVVLIGHSQGGAAVTQVCASEKVVRSANISGIVILGSESPIEAVRPEEAVQMALSMGESVPEPTEITHTTRPTGIPADRMLFIHSTQDRVIHHSQIEQLADAWGGVPLIKLHCDARAQHPDVPWADDLQHDFLTLHMLTQVVHNIDRFLSEK